MRLLRPCSVKYLNQFQLENLPSTLPQRQNWFELCSLGVTCFFSYNLRVEGHCSQIENDVPPPTGSPTNRIDPWTRPTRALLFIIMISRTFPHLYRIIQYIKIISTVIRVPCEYVQLYSEFEFCSCMRGSGHFFMSGFFYAEFVTGPAI